MLKKEVIILIAEDDEGHASLIQKNLRRAGISNEFIHFKNGQDVLDFLYQKGSKPHKEENGTYLLLLDIRMPKIDGVEVLKQIKADEKLRPMPVIMITTTDDPREVNTCYELGCSNYITKPVDYDNFVESIRKLGLFLLIVELPKLNNK